MTRPGLKGATFQQNVADDLEIIRKARGFRSIAETIAMLAVEAKMKLDYPDLDQVKISSGSQYASTNTKAAFTLPAERCALDDGHAGNHMSLSDMSREGFEPPADGSGRLIPGSLAHSIVASVYNFSEL
jgi:hypothetical protein